MTAKGLAGTKSSAATSAAMLRVGVLVLACGFICVAQAAQQSVGGASASQAAPAKSGAASSNSTSTGATSTATKKTPAKKRHHHTASTATGSKSATTSSTASGAKRSTSSRKKRTARTRGQQKIDSDRVQEIQEALIREHYLNGEASGKWNETSEAAMRKYQGDHGWQTKTVPDSRALIKLGLGPSHDHLLNPESAMTTGPDAPRAAVSAPPVSESKEPISNTPAPTSGTQDPVKPE